MDAPAPAPTPPPRGSRFSRRTLFKLAGGAAALGFGAEFVRVVLLANTHTVIPGRVYRTAQLSPEQLREFIAEKGIRTVVNLRGVCSNMPWYIAECRATHAAGVNQEDITFSAKRYPAPTEMQRLIEVLDHTAYPIVFHCQAGADRTGLAAAVALLTQTDASLSVARRQLWPRYGHVAVGRVAMLDEFFDFYEEWLGARGAAHAPDLFRKWVNEDYCPGAYRAELSVVGGPLLFAAHRGFAVTVRAANRSIKPWDFTPGGAGGIRMRHTLTSATGVILHQGFAGQFARTVNPGEYVDLVCGLPPMPAGNYPFHADLSDAQPIDLLDSDFVQYGSEPLHTTVTVS
jgi:protein tyrosine phosphatase (PTP) superfamily phosphohydrolase (DUF442 family)